MILPIADIQGRVRVSIEWDNPIDWDRTTPQGDDYDRALEFAQSGYFDLYVSEDRNCLYFDNGNEKFKLCFRRITSDSYAEDLN